MKHQRVIETISDAMMDVESVKALFLSGSHGNGRADAYSDIDFLLISENGATEALGEAWKEAVANTGKIVLWWDHTKSRSLINAITEDWRRIDVNILEPEQLTHFSQHDLKPILDPENKYAELRERKTPSESNIGKFKYQVEEFLRIIGLLHLVEGRKEYLNGVLGIFHLRNLLVELLIDETNAPDRGGVLHLNRLIADEQKELLLQLPAAIPERDAIIDAHIAYAKAYFPRARKRASQLNMDWPEDFEAATWAMLERDLSIKRPY